MVNIDWESEFKKQLELNKNLVKQNLNILRKQRDNFVKKVYWIQDYPQIAGWYWIKFQVDGFPGMEYFYPDTDGKLYAEDIEGGRAGEDCFKGYWFSSDPIKEPEDL